MRNFVLAFLLLLPSAVLAAAPPHPQPENPQDQLFAALAKADSPSDARPIEKKLIGLFKESGSPGVDLLMTRFNTALGASDNAAARRLADAVTGLAPRYAEGWRARAQLQALSGDDAGAMISLQKTVLLNPRQFDAMVELAGMLEDYGDKPGALKLYRHALALDPQLTAAADRVKALSRAVEGQGI